MQPDATVIIELLKKGDPAYFKEQYELYYKEFMHYAFKKGIPTDAAKDIYQEAFITLFENAATGKLTALTSSLKTYVFGIANFKMLAFHRKNKKHVNLDPAIDIKEETTISLENETLSNSQTQLFNALQELGARCKNMLHLFYLDGLTIKEIMEVEDYSSENTVKAQKSRCLKQLKELAKQPHG